MRQLFGTDGVRGAANIELTPALAVALGQAAGAVLAAGAPGATMVVGRDTRESGSTLEAALAAGLCSAGVSVVSAGVVTTPAVALLARQDRFAAGAVISASHNPASENGIKFLGHDGRKLADETEARIEELVHEILADPSRAPRPAPGGLGTFSTDTGLRAAYEREVKWAFAGRREEVRIVLDGANGAGYLLNPEVLEELGFAVTCIHCSPDGLNINEGCGSTHPEDLCAEVVRLRADLGAAFDGDGDRVILCDEKGVIVDGDRVLAICAGRRANTPDLPGNHVVGTVMSNVGLETYLSSVGVNFHRAAVGDRYVAELMRETGAAIGGEKSGHIIFSRFSTTGDGLVTLLQVLTEMSRTSRPLSELAGVVTEYPQLLVGVPVRSKAGWDSDAGVRAAIAAGDVVLAGRGRLLVRASGTENLIRVMAEGPDEAEVRSVVDGVCAAVRAWAQ